MKQIKVSYKGRVQGVGFRWTTLEIARNFAVTGFVRNKKDGSVELVAEGTEEALTCFLEAVDSGRLGKNIESKKISWREASRDFSDFQIGYE